MTKNSASSNISVRDRQNVKNALPTPEDTMSSRKRESQYSAYLTLEKDLEGIRNQDCLLQTNRNPVIKVRCSAQEQEGDSVLRTRRQ